MNKYDLQIRGEKVHIEFERINDSRRVSNYKFGTAKRPNLFKIKAAMACRVEMPLSLCPDWCKEFGATFPFNGIGFCFHKDDWSAKKGRHRSLAEALNYAGHDKELNAEITVAFSVEETRRTKVKGPARIPKTAAPKPRRRSTLERIADALETLACPTCSISDDYAQQPEDTYQQVMVGNIRPADKLNGTLSTGDNA